MSVKGEIDKAGGGGNWKKSSGHISLYLSPFHY